MKLKLTLMAIALTALSIQPVIAEVEYCDDGNIRTSDTSCDSDSFINQVKNSVKQTSMQAVNVTCDDGTFVATMQECNYTDKENIEAAPRANNSAANETKEYCENGELKKIGTC